MISPEPVAEKPAEPAPIPSASLEGTVTFEGVEAAVASAPASVVYVLGFEEDPPGGGAIAMDQINKSFIPNVIALTKGQKVSFPNKDNIHHNVFSVSQAKMFDLGHTGPGDSPSVAFTRTGLIDVYCNIHPEMVSNILVLPNRAYAVVPSKSGKFRIDGIPPGQKTVQAWNRQGKAQKETIDFISGKTARIGFKIPITADLPPHTDKHGKAYSGKQPRY